MIFCHLAQIDAQASWETHLCKSPILFRIATDHLKKSKSEDQQQVIPEALNRSHNFEYSAQSTQTLSGSPKCTNFGNWIPALDGNHNFEKQGRKRKLAREAQVA